MNNIGLQTQIWNNNLKSIMLLCLFPILLFSLSFIGIFLDILFGNAEDYEAYSIDSSFIKIAWDSFSQVAPNILFTVSIWFTIAFFFHTTLIKRATGAHSLTRKENKRVYNLIENLCLTVGMSPPKIHIIEDDSLNAFASGINKRTYTITLSRGIINKLDDEELEGVIAHELTHILNRDVRLLIVSIIFVGIFAYISEGLLRLMRFKKKSDLKIFLIIALSHLGYLVSLIFQAALSRNREYMADAGAVSITKNPLALASALRKISSDSCIEAVERRDVAQLFIENPQNNHNSSIDSLFSTHPPIEKRIQILEQF